jgi:hypothetical protein
MFPFVKKLPSRERGPRFTPVNLAKIAKQKRRMKNKLARAERRRQRLQNN